MIRTDKYLRTLSFGGNVQPASIDLHWGGLCRLPRTAFDVLRTPLAVNVTDKQVEVWEPETIVPAVTLPPSGLVMLVSAEKVTIPKDHVALLVSKSTPGRRGLLHAHAGLFDPGFSGHATWEMFNAMPFSITISRGASLVQLIFLQCDEEANGYNGQYQEAS